MIRRVSYKSLYDENTLLAVDINAIHLIFKGPESTVWREYNGV